MATKSWLTGKRLLRCSPNIQMVPRGSLHTRLEGTTWDWLLATKHRFTPIGSEYNKIPTIQTFCGWEEAQKQYKCFFLNGNAWQIPTIIYTTQNPNPKPMIFWVTCLAPLGWLSYRSSPFQWSNNNEEVMGNCVHAVLKLAMQPIPPSAQR